MSAIDSTPENYPADYDAIEEKDVDDLSVIDGKISRIWMAVAASICLVGAIVTGVLAFTITLWLLVPSISLFLASGVLIRYACQPSESVSIEKPPLHIKLAEALTTNGWDRLAQVFSPAEFDLAYSEHVREMKLSELIDFYKEATTHLQGTQLIIPEPKRWIGKLESETNGLDYRLLMDHFSLRTLIKYSLIKPVELKESFIAFANSSPLQTVIKEYEKTLSHIHPIDRFSLPALSLCREKLAEETKGFDYETLINHFSLTELIRYSLITPDELAKSFDSYARPLPITKVIEEYEKLVKKLELFPPFARPFHPEWKAKFGMETALLKATEISGPARYPIEKLFRFGVIGPQEHKLLKAAITERHQFRQLENHLELEFRNKIASERDDAKKRADQLGSHLIAKQKELFKLHFQNLKTAEDLAAKHLALEQIPVTLYEAAHPSMTPEESQYFAALKKKCEENSLKIKQTVEQKKRSYHLQSQQSLMKLEEALHATSSLKNESYKAAERKYNNALMSLHQDMEKQLAPSREEVEKKLSQIDQEYDELRSKKG